MSNSPYISLNEAAALTGRAKSTISKALKNGKMSFISKDPKTGAYEIDPAEAERAFPAKQETSKSYHVENTRNPTENSILQVKLDAANQRFDDAEKTIEDLRSRLDKSEGARERTEARLEDQRAKMENLLTEQRQQPEPPKRGFWARLVG